MNVLDDFSRRYTEAWNSHDPGRLAALCSDDVVWSTPALVEPLRGHEGVAKFAAESFRMMPDFTITATDSLYVSGDGNRTLLPYRMEGTMHGPWDFLGLAPTGRRLAVDGIDRFELRDGLISRYDTYWDTAGGMRQLGVLPPLGSRRDRAVTRLQHVQARFQRRAAG